MSEMFKNEESRILSVLPIVIGAAGIEKGSHTRVVLGGTVINATGGKMRMLSLRLNGAITVVRDVEWHRVESLVEIAQWLPK